MDREPGRDRDAKGRARNARRRDRLGRPLRRGQAGVDPWPEGTAHTPAESLALAQDLLDDGWPFRAHEVLEAAWKAAPIPERQLWRGLAQLAVGVTHAARGNQRGATALLRRGRDAVALYVDASPHEVDVPALLAWAQSCLIQLADREACPVVLAPPRLRRN